MESNGQWCQHPCTRDTTQLRSLPADTLFQFPYQAWCMLAHVSPLSRVHSSLIPLSLHQGFHLQITPAFKLKTATFATNNSHLISQVEFLQLLYKNCTCLVRTTYSAGFSYHMEMSNELSFPIRIAGQRYQLNPHQGNNTHLPPKKVPGNAARCYFGHLVTVTMFVST